MKYAKMRTIILVYCMAYTITFLEKKAFFVHNITFATFPYGAFTDLTPYQYGREECESGHAFGPARRSHFLFHLIVSGKGTLVADDEEGRPIRYKLGAGQGFMVFPGQVTTYAADLKDPWQYTWIEFDGLRVKSALDSIGLTPSNPIYSSKSSELRETMRSEISAIVNGRDSNEFELIGHLYLFFGAFLGSISVQRVEVPPSKANDRYSQEAIRYIEENYRGDISVERLAEMAGLNRSYFGKVFKQATGKTPQQYLLLYRMAKAAELLKLTALSIADISKSVGYPNQLHFSRAFKNTYGLSPREWRKESLLVTEHELPRS